jgi:hypothetical protein
MSLVPLIGRQAGGLSYVIGAARLLIVAVRSLVDRQQQ